MPDPPLRLVPLEKSTAPPTAPTEKRAAPADNTIAAPALALLPTPTLIAPPLPEAELPETTERCPLFPEAADPD